MQTSKRLTFVAKSVLLSFGAVLSMAHTSVAEVVNITLLHLNDIYEITPVEGGKRGGMARVATLRQRLLAKNPRTFTLLAGDALSPSALGTAKVNGRRLAGQQMVAAMNAIGFDYATLGNHEFDLSKEEFLQRLNESKFRWISANVDNEAGQAFPKVERSQILTVKGNRGTTVRVGLIGLTIDSNPANYVRYRDPIQTAKNQVAALRGKVDAIVALTHLSLAEDQQLAAAVPEIDLILGGHEHENVQQWRLVQRPVRSSRCIDKGIPIFKADANARTVYVHTLRYDTTSRCLTIDSQLQPITAALPDDPKTAEVVQDWLQKGFQAFRESGFEPNQAVATTTESLDGLEESVRNRSTNLTDLIAKAMLREVGDAELSIFNGGSIRIDDRLPPGTISQYDIIRILPFGGKVLSVEIPGALLKRVLDQGRANRGSGGYLQTANVEYNDKTGWQIQGKPLESDRTYKVAINDFLMSGKEQNLGFLSLQAPGVKLTAEKRDIRFAVIQEMQKRREIK
ncbi:bifunctional metallophosphatase/5'-nucleotidase [Cyanobacteria bacterium FACHB-63]|nr:bifunctional metallophosphatase/5'-nucleotidase [Cyanobacteria bacterium FACHB-63]